MDQDQTLLDIEKLFAEASPDNLRDVSRKLERLVRTVQDAKTRSRYEAVIDQLPEMVKHLSEE